MEPFRPFQGGQWSQIGDARLSRAGFEVKVQRMRRAPLRPVYVLMLGLLMALGMSFAAIQPSSMATGMTMTGQQMSASSMGDCGSCKDIPASGKIMVCDATCAAPVNATLQQVAALLIKRTAERPLSNFPILAGWTASPNPHPPKHVALI